MPRRTRSTSKERESETKADKSQPSHSRRSAAADTESGILSLQHTVGNRAVSQLLQSNAKDLAQRSGDEPRSVNEVVSSSGEKLDPATRNLMESRFAKDFGDVQVHTDAKAGESAEALGARAYTVGTDIVFGKGEYAPETNEGQKRIAHELAHVIQQKQSGSSNPSPVESLSSPQDGSEREAQGVSHTVARGQQAPTIAAAAVGIQRDEKKDDKIPLLDEFAKKFPDAAKLILKQTAALELVKEAATAGAQFGGYAEDGPPQGAAGGRAYTIGSKVYVPRLRTDPVMAMRDFLFELNNAVRKPKFDVLDKEATKGSTGTLNAKTYAYKTVELEVEGMLRLGKIWFEIKKTMPKGKKTDDYGPQFFLPDYEAVKSGKKSKDDLVKDVLKRVYDTGDLRGKTVEQNYMKDYQDLSGGK